MAGASGAPAVCPHRGSLKPEGPNKGRVTTTRPLASTANSTVPGQLPGAHKALVRTCPSLSL